MRMFLRRVLASALLLFVLASGCATKPDAIELAGSGAGSGSGDDSFYTFDQDFKDLYCTTILFTSHTDAMLDEAGCGSETSVASLYSPDTDQIIEDESPPGEGSGSATTTTTTATTTTVNPYFWGLFGRAAALGGQLYRAMGAFATALAGPGSGPMTTLLRQWGMAFTTWVGRVGPTIGQARRLLNGAGNHGVVRGMRGGLAWIARATNASNGVRRALVYVGTGLLLIGVAYGGYKIWSYFTAAEDASDGYQFARHVRIAAEDAERRLQTELRDAPQTTKDVHDTARSVVSYATLLIQLEGIAAGFSAHLLTNQQRMDVAAFITQLRADEQVLLAIRAAVINGTAPTQTQIDNATTIVRRYETWADNRPTYLRTRTRELVGQFTAGPRSTGQTMLDKLTLIRGRNIAPDVERLNGIFNRVRAAVMNFDALAHDLELFSRLVAGINDRLEANVAVALDNYRDWDAGEIRFLTEGDHAVTATVPSTDEINSTAARSDELRADLTKVDDDIAALIRE